MKWSTATTTEFLNMYAHHPCLWDSNNSDYKDKSKRAYAMETILRDLHMNELTLDMLKTKIHSIRNTYTNEKRKIEKSKKSSSGDAHVYVPKMSWFALADSFLGKTIRTRRSHSNLELEDTPYDAEYATSFTQELECDDSNTSTTPVCEKKTFSKSSPTKKEKENGNFSPLNDLVEALKKIATLPQEDELDAFGKSMVAQMRRLPEEYAVEIMSEIQSLLANKRLKFIADKKRIEDQVTPPTYKYNLPL